MGLLNKMLTAIRGGAREVGENIVDANGIRIFEQEINDAETELEKGKRDLTSVVAKEMEAKRNVANLTDEIVKHEKYAKDALDQKNEELALEVAQKIAELTSQLGIQVKAEESFKNHAAKLKDLIKKTQKSLASMKRELVMVKTTDSVQKATTAITSNYASSNSKLLSAKESLDRIQKRQQDLDDRLVAGGELYDEFEGKDLEAKLKDAGIVENDNSAQDILERLRSNKTGE